MIDERRSGILLHITSLPSRFGMGDLGPEAYRFADWLRTAGQGLWQTLPLSATTAAGNYSPYSSPSAFAGNALLISPEILRDDGLLAESELQGEPATASAEKINFRRAAAFRQKLLAIACGRFADKLPNADFDRFCQQNAFWLDDYARFVAIGQHRANQMWTKWPAALRDRRPTELRKVDTELAESMLQVRIRQYLFHRQWWALKSYCNSRGLQLVGDMPIYVAYDSADVWSHPEIFQLDRNKRLTAVSGIPPSDLAPGGQLWGMPLYDWKRLARDDYRWWIERIGQNLKLYDWLRIDHFLGLANYWKIPAQAKTAKQGQWVSGPRENLFRALYCHFASLPLIAEDLGFVTLEARAIMQRYNLPGLKVVIDAFSRPAGSNDFAPHNHDANCLVCTGTHDFNTVRGWYEHQSSEKERRQFFDYIGREISAAEAPWEMIRLALTSVGRMAIIPMQDVLALGREARMNVPGRPRGNWLWRMLPDQADDQLAARLKRLTWLTGRS